MADIQVTTIADLKAYSLSGLAANTIAEVICFSSPGDLGGGQFYLDTSSSSQDLMEGLMVIPTSTSITGRWVRIISSTEYNSAWVNIVPNDGFKKDLLDELVNLNISFDVLFNGSGDIPIEGPEISGNGRKFIFRNNCRLIGDVNSYYSGISAILVDCDYQKACFGENLLVTNLLNQKVSVMWFGAKPDFPVGGGTVVTDSLSAFNQARDAGVSEIYLPGVLDGSHAYYLSDTFVLDSHFGTTIHGDGVSKTIIRIGDSITGIHLDLAKNCKIHDLTLTASNMVYGEGVASSGFNSDVCHGILVEGLANQIYNVWIFGFDGDGIRVEGHTNETGFPNRNADLNRIVECYLYGNGRAGLYVFGNEANVCYFEKINAVANARWGIWDNSLLGNTHNGHHVSANALEHPLNQTHVRVEGPTGTFKLYRVKKNITVAGTFKPGIDTDWELYWDFIGTVTPIPPATPPFGYSDWVNSKQYYIGGGFYVNGHGNASVFTSCYVETYQLIDVEPLSPALFIGGVASAGGALPNSVGQSQTFLTANSIRALSAIKDQGVEITNILEDPASGNVLSFIGVRDGTNRFGLTWNLSTNSIYQNVFTLSSGFGGDYSMLLASPEANKSHFGNIPSLPKGGVVFAELWFTIGNSQHRRLAGSLYPPFGNGNYYISADLLINYDHQNGNVLGWRCIETGISAASHWSTILADLSPINSTGLIDAGAATEHRIQLASGSNSINNPTRSAAGQKIRIRLKQPSTGSGTILWGGGVTPTYRFAGGTAPTLSSGLSKTDYLEFVYNDTDNTWDCINVQLGF